MKKSLAAVSVATLTLLYGILAAVAAFICIASDVDMLYALLVAVGVLLLQFIISPWLTDLNMRLFYKVRFDRPVPEFITDFVAGLCEENNMKMPKIGIIEDGSPNAFTYGHTKNDARIVITRGLIDMLDEDEVRGVVGHEMGHAVHYDMLVMTAAQIVPMILYYLYQLLMEAVQSSDNSDNDDDGGAGYLLIVALGIYVLYVISNYIILWLSRTREYYADEFAARATRNPNALASALVQIGFGLSTGSEERESKLSASRSNTLGIADGKAGKGMALCCMDGDIPDKRNVKKAMRWDMWNVWAKLYELQSTHPLTSKRILALSELSAEYAQSPYIVFDEEKPESFVDDFFKEIFISFIPFVALIAAALLALCEVYAYALVALEVFFILSLLKYRYSHPKCEGELTDVNTLLGEVKVSKITAIPCKLRGRIIGRGDPGCIFNEDFVIRDNTGIMFLNYDRMLTIQNKLFALFRSSNYLYNEVEVEGWYRRCPTPYMDLKYIRCGDIEKRCDKTRFGYTIRILGLIAVPVLAILFFL